MRSRAARSPEIVALAGACVAAFVLILSLGAGLSFFNDEWAVILGRQGWSADSLLGPHNEHIYVGVVLVYKLLLAAFGMDSTLPFRIVNTALVVAVAVLVFSYMRPRVGGWPAGLAGCALLFFGPSWENLLWGAAGISFMATLAAGLAALLLVDRRSHRGDLAACVLLVVSVSFSTLGLFFVAGIALDLVLRDRRSALRRAYVVLIPAASYGLWYLGYGASATAVASTDNLTGLPEYVLSSFWSVASSLLGLGVPGGGDSTTVELTRSVLIGCALVLLIALARRSGRPNPRFWVILAIAVAFWASAGINELPGREPQASRYQLIGAVLVLIAVSELVRGQTLSVPWGWGLTVLSVVVIALNVGSLRDGERFLRTHSEIATADLAALEIARAQIHPAFRLHPEIAGTPYLDHFYAGQYFEGTANWGSPADSEQQLAAAPESSRAAADLVLVSALEIVPQPSRGAPAPGAGHCTELTLRAHRPEVVSLASGQISFEALDGAETEVLLRRYARRDFVTLGSLQTPRATELSLPAGGSSRPWQVGLRGEGGVVVCRISAGAR